MANPTPPTAASLLYGSTDYGNGTPKTAAPPPAAARSAGPSVLSAAALMYGSTTPSPPQPPGPAGQLPARVQAAPAAPHAQVPEPEPKAAPRPEDEGRQTTADLLFGDTPDDGQTYVNYGEMALDSAAAVPLDMGDLVDTSAHAQELAQVREGILAAGLGHTLSAAVVAQAQEAFKQGARSPEQLAALHTSTMDVLTKKWGKQTDAKIAAAAGVVQAAAAKWPGIVQFLEASGLGSDPKLIQRLAARAARAPKR